MKHSSDSKTLLFVIAICILRIWMYWTVPIAWYFNIVINSFLILLIIVIKHNQVHQAVFQSRSLNRLYIHVLNFLSGSTAASMKIIHIVNHHEEINRESDWACTKEYEERNPFLSFLRYCWESISTFNQEKKKWVNQHKESSLAKELKQENILMLSIYLVLLILDWRTTIVVFILPTILSQFILISTNFFQHAYCDPASEVNSSRNFTGDIFNWFFFNVGFHTVHHLYPEAHWSELPERHKEFTTQLQPDLQMENVFQIYKVIFYGK